MKKTLTVLSALLIVFSFAACDGENTNNIESTQDDSSVSTIEESTFIDESKDDESQNISEQSEYLETSNIVEDIYYGNGYSFSVPKDFTIYQENENSVIFINNEYLTFHVDKIKKPDTIMTEKYFRDCCGDSVIAFKELTVDGEYAVYMVHSEKDNGVDYNFCEYAIYTDNMLFFITYRYADDYTKNIFDQTMSSFEID